jgi:hypothetical protein
VIEIVVLRDCNHWGFDTAREMMVRTPSAFFSFLWTTFSESDSFISHWERRKRLVPDWRPDFRGVYFAWGAGGNSSPLFPKLVNAVAHEGESLCSIAECKMYGCSIFLRQF